MPWCHSQVSETFYQDLGAAATGSGKEARLMSEVFRYFAATTWKAFWGITHFVLLSPQGAAILHGSYRQRKS